MRIAREGFREIAVATIVLGAAGVACVFFVWPLAIVCVALWVFVVLFFRDPVRDVRFGAGVLCAPADGTITEISRPSLDELMGGRAMRIGIFLSLFDVHINRSPCSGRVRSVAYQSGEFLDARHAESGGRNESTTIVLDPDEPLPGPVIVRQVAGLVARRIICHARKGDRLAIGSRFGLIKFGSRTELIVPLKSDTVLLVTKGEKVRAGVTALVRQPAARGSAAGRVGEGSTGASTAG